MSEITGKVIAILPEQRFNGKNGEVVRNSFVIETSGQYPKKIAFNVIGEDKWKQMNVQVGTDVQVGFDVSSREWQGKWFTQADAWKVSVIGGGHQQTQSVVPNAQPYVAPQQQSQQDDSGLPF